MTGVAGMPAQAVDAIKRVNSMNDFLMPCFLFFQFWDSVVAGRRLLWPSWSKIVRVMAGLRYYPTGSAKFGELFATSLSATLNPIYSPGKAKGGRVRG